MQKAQRLEKTDKWIVGLSVLCALLLFTWLVYDMAFLNPLLEGQVEIGKIYEARNKVKRKFNRSLIWYAADQNETVFENDWIFTGSQSIAKIKLNDGGEIIVEPDSLIILSRKNGVLQLDLQHGRLMADIKQVKQKVKINIVRDGNIQTVDTSKGVVSVSQKDEPSAIPEIEDIDLNIDGEEQEALSLSDLADQKYFEPEVGFEELDKNNLSFPKESVFEFSLYKGQTAIAPLTWQDPYEKWASFDTEVAEDKEFQVGLKQANNEKPKYNLATKTSGDFFWKVRGRDIEGEPGNWSEVQLAKVIINYKEKAPSLELSRKKILYQLERSDLDSIQDNRLYEFVDKEPIEVTWQGVENATRYKVQTSDKKDFSNIIEESSTTESSMQFGKLKLGSTFFRVIPEAEEGVAVAEQAIGEVRTHLPAPSGDSLKTKDKMEHQIVRWEKLPHAEAYEVSYKTDKNSKNMVRKVVTKNSMKIESGTGFLQWKVRVVDPETKVSMSRQSDTVDWYDAAKRLASLHGTGQAGAEYPKILSPESRKTFISVNSSPLFIVMKWQYGNDAKTYEVEISKKPNMEALVYNKKVTQKRAVINQRFKPGVYFMRVRATTDDVTQESWSEVEAFRVIDRKVN